MQDFEKLGLFYLGRPVDPATRRGPRGAAALRFARPGHPRGLRRHDRQRQDRPLHRPARGGGDRRHAGDRDRSQGRSRQPAADLSRPLAPRTSGPGSTRRTRARKGLDVPRTSPRRRPRCGRRASPSGARTASASGASARRSTSASTRRAATPACRSRSSPPFAAPPPELVDDPELFGDRVESPRRACSAWSASTPIRCGAASTSWSRRSSTAPGATGEELDLARSSPTSRSRRSTRSACCDLESFFPAKERFELAMKLNNLLASPGFDAWLKGEPLDVQRLLYTAEGKPRVSVLSIAHLSDAERMFFVSLLLNEMLGWMRTQQGTTSLRALLYMDEIFGYLPPTANPPSKKPMLTLLKQARAFGLGVVLATQNPVDLDYKALSNIGTWFLGRLQTERDKARVLDGLEGVAGGHRPPGAVAHSRRSRPARASCCTTCTRRSRCSSRAAGRCRTSPDLSPASRSAGSRATVQGQPPLPPSRQPRRLHRLERLERPERLQRPKPAAPAPSRQPGAGAGALPILPAEIAVLFAGAAGRAAGLRRRDPRAGQSPLRESRCRVELHARGGSGAADRCRRGADGRLGGL